MDGNDATEKPARSTSLTKDLALRFIQIFGTTAVIALILFVSAGTIKWNRGWVYVLLSVGCLLVNAVIVLRTNPEVAAARARIHRGTKTFDKVFSVAYAPLVLALPALAGLDAVRFGWSSMPSWTVYPGAVFFVLGMVPVTWALAVNRHLEQTVRIQEDRGHQVVTTGPYRMVRHPMYLGMLVYTLATPLLLGSCWAYVIVAAILVLVVIRTALEDRTLHEELAGYREYAARTRYRLVPFLW